MWADRFLRANWFLKSIYYTNIQMSNYHIRYRMMSLQWSWIHDNITEYSKPALCIYRSFSNYNQIMLCYILIGRITRLKKLIIPVFLLIYVLNISIFFSDFISLLPTIIKIFSERPRLWYINSFNQMIIGIGQIKTVPRSKKNWNDSPVKKIL